MHTKNKLNKPLCTTLVIIPIVILLGLAYVAKNLGTYQIYYAQHIPHAKGTNPVMTFIIDDLGYLPDIKGLRYDDDGYNVIIKEETVGLRHLSENDSEYKVVLYERANIGKQTEMDFRTYSFSKSGKFINYSYYSVPKDKYFYETSDTRKKEAQQYLDDILNPIIVKMDKKPIINLQWLFNKLYQKRFET